MIPYLVSILINKYPAISARVYPVMIPQDGVFPAMRIIENRMSPDGTKEAVSQLDDHQVVIDIFSYTYKETHELSDAIRADLDRQHFQPAAAPFIADISVDSIRDAGYEQDKRLYHRIIDLTIHTKPN